MNMLKPSAQAQGIPGQARDDARDDGFWGLRAHPTISDFALTARRRRRRPLRGSSRFDANQANLSAIYLCFVSIYVTIHLSNLWAVGFAPYKAAAAISRRIEGGIVCLPLLSMSSYR